MRLIRVIVNLETEELGLEFAVSLPSAEPAVGATVVCDGKTETTNAEGLAVIGPFIEGEYDYTVSLSGYKTVSGKATVA